MDCSGNVQWSFYRHGYRYRNARQWMDIRRPANEVAMDNYRYVINRKLCVRRLIFCVSNYVGKHIYLGLYADGFRYLPDGSVCWMLLGGISVGRFYRITTNLHRIVQFYANHLGYEFLTNPIFSDGREISHIFANWPRSWWECPWVPSPPIPFCCHVYIVGSEHPKNDPSVLVWGV